jgi:hypothetical protein
MRSVWPLLIGALFAGAEGVAETRRREDEPPEPMRGPAPPRREPTPEELRAWQASLAADETRRVANETRKEAERIAKLTAENETYAKAVAKRDRIRQRNLKLKGNNR